MKFPSTLNRLPKNLTPNAFDSDERGKSSRVKKLPLRSKVRDSDVLTNALPFDVGLP